MIANLILELSESQVRRGEKMEGWRMSEDIKKENFRVKKMIKHEKEKQALTYHGSLQLSNF